MFTKIKKWLFGTGFEIGEKVYLKSRLDSSLRGEYIVTTKRDKKGNVVIYNEKSKYQTVPYWRLKSMDWYSEPSE